MTSSAGYPFDKTYYQAVKGMVGALDVLEPGGDLIIVSACSEGIGSPDYAEAQMCLANAGPEGFLRGILDLNKQDTSFAEIIVGRFSNPPAINAAGNTYRLFLPKEMLLSSAVSMHCTITRVALDNVIFGKAVH